MMTIKKLILPVLFVLILQTPVWAQENESVALYNQVIQSIYDRIFALKGQYPELATFDSAAIKQNTLDDFKQISYSLTSPTGREYDIREHPYAFGFTIKAQRLRSQTEGEETEGEWVFPLLGFKVNLEVPRVGQSAKLDVQKIIDKEMNTLRILEQKSLPVRLELATDKSVYAPDETVTLTVTLNNLAGQNYQAVELDEESLLCQIDETTWGTLDGDTTETVLESHGSLQKILRVQGAAEPRTSEISCFYTTKFRGIHPFGRVTFETRSAS